MAEFFKAYEPTKKGKELIALLFPLDNNLREKNLISYWQKYPSELTAVIEGFHYILKDLSENKLPDESLPPYQLNEEFLDIVVGEMVTQKNYFSYARVEEYFDIIKKQSPAVLVKPEYLYQIIKKTNQKENPSKIEIPTEFNQKTLEKCQKLGIEVFNAYEEIKGILPSIKNAHFQMKNAHLINEQDNEHKEIELELAKETFAESKNIYNKYATVISSSLPFFYGLYKAFDEELILHKVYLKYLAKFLSSRETRFSVELYVYKLAEGPFDFTEPIANASKSASIEENAKMVLIDKLKKEFGEQITKLECRYKKRQLMVQKSKGLAISKIIKELIILSELDPTDIRTHILLAKMFAEYSKKSTNMQQRANFRAQALSYCTKVSAGIDEYLTLQGIEKMSARDRERISFNKTIASIRLPLLK